MTEHLTRVRIRDYQSLADVEFEPGPLTVIVGDNDAGKTSIMRAIRAACFNETGSANIRRGQERSQVVLEFGDGVYVRWTKVRDGGAEYKLVVGDGEEQRFTKLGAAVPPEVQAALRVAEIEVAKDFRIQPQFHSQEEYYFLLDKPEGQAARALAKMTKLDVVVEAQQLIRTDLKRAKADLKATDDNITALKSTLDIYETLDDAVAACERAETIVEAIAVSEGKLVVMSTAYNAWVEAQADVVTMKAIPTAAAVQSLKDSYNDVRAKVQAWREYEAARDARAALPSTIPDMPRIAEQYERLMAMQAAFHVHYVAHVEAIDIEDQLAAQDTASRQDTARWNELKTCPECGQPLEKR